MGDGIIFLEMGDDFVEMHHVAIFVMHVEQIDLVRQFRPVEDAFLCDCHVISV